PDVLRMANEYFSFLHDTPAQVQTVLGDARMSMAREESQQFDVLVLDAFSGDAIPVHLLTRECFELYLKHLKSNGIIAIHISNQHLDLAPVVVKLAEHFKLSYVQTFSKPRPQFGEYRSRWMLLTTDNAWLNSPPIKDATVDL